VTDKKDVSTLCVVMSESDNSDLHECRIIDPVRKAMAADASISDLEHLDVRLPVVQAMREQLQGINIESEMLRLRKRALKRRICVLEMLANSLKSGDDDPTGG
jgi:propanediol utilization protein